MTIIEPPWTDEQIDGLRRRNALRVREAIERLGPSYVLYKRQPEPIVIELAIDSTRFDRGMNRIDAAVNSLLPSVR